jgi:tartrate dehydratase alpha subunit/fumarate hydratase class I-like protein
VAPHCGVRLITAPGVPASRHAITLIRKEDFISSLRDALRYIACYHPPDFIPGSGIGGTAEMAVLMARESLLEPITLRELLGRGAGQAAWENCALDCSRR